MMITSNESRTGLNALRSFVSRPVISVSRRTSAAVRSWLAGSSEKPAGSIGTMAEAMSHSPSSTSQVLRWSCLLSIPQPMVALPCGSMSISSARRCVAASDAVRLTAVVVLPTPPFWLVIAMTCSCAERRAAPSAPPGSITTQPVAGKHCGYDRAPSGRRSCWSAGTPGGPARRSPSSRAGMPWMSASILASVEPP